MQVNSGGIEPSAAAAVRAPHALLPGRSRHGPLKRVPAALPGCRSWPARTALGHRAAGGLVSGPEADCAAARLRNAVARPKVSRQHDRPGEPGAVPSPTAALAAAATPGRLGHRLPCPGRDAAIAWAAAPWSGPGEISGIDVVPHLVAPVPCSQAASARIWHYHLRCCRGHAGAGCVSCLLAGGSQRCGLPACHCTFTSRSFLGRRSDACAG